MRHELIDGEHYVTPSPNTAHQRVVGQLHGLIWTYLRTRPVGELFTAPFELVFSHVDVVEPDLLFVSRERASILTPANVQGSPDLVVEVQSPATGRRDETIKRSLYNVRGCPDWLVNPDAHTVRVYRRRGASYGEASILTLTARDVLTSRLFPDLQIPLSDIFHTAAQVGRLPRRGPAEPRQSARPLRRRPAPIAWRLRRTTSARERLMSRRGGESYQIFLGVGHELFAQFSEARGTAVADRRAQVLQHVVDHGPHRSASRHADLEPLGAERFDFVRVGFLEIEAIRTAASDAMPRNTLNGTCTTFCDRASAPT